MEKKQVTLIIFLLIVLMGSVGCKQSPSLDKAISDSQFMLGTIITLQIYASEDEKLLADSFQLIKSVDDSMSLTNTESEISLINKNAGIKPTELSEDIYYVIKTAIEYSKLSEGGFDITMEPVIGLWGIGTDDAKVPGQEALKDALSRVDYTKIALDDVHNTIYLEQGMSIDLGAIAKGFAADKVADYLEDKGVVKAILNLGGNVLLIGEKSEGAGFKVGLQNPFEERNDYFAVIEVSDETVVTSGIYERNFTVDNVTYHHILDTKTGYPVDNQVASVSVITERSINADALSTVLFVLGVEEGLALVETLDFVECIYVTRDREVFTSSGVKNDLVITSSGFKVMD